MKESYSHEDTHVEAVCIFEYKSKIQKMVKILSFMIIMCDGMAMNCYLRVNNVLFFNKRDVSPSCKTSFELISFSS